MAEKEEQTKDKAAGEGEGSKDFASLFENYKKEQDRKMGNLESILQATAETNARLEQALTAQQTRPQATDDDDDDDGYLTKEERRAIEKVAKAQADKARDAALAEVHMQQQRTQVLTQLGSEYPELLDQTSELYQEAQKTHASLGQALQNTPDGYRIAVREAAAKKGMLPMAQRPKTGASNEDPPFGRGTGSGKADRRDKDDIDDRTEDFARLVGVDIEDEEVKERIKEFSKRSWGSYR